MNTIKWMRDIIILAVSSQYPYFALAADATVLKHMVNLEGNDTYQMGVGWSGNELLIGVGSVVIGLSPPETEGGSDIRIRTVADTRKIFDSGIPAQPGEVGKAVLINRVRTFPQEAGVISLLSSTSGECVILNANSHEIFWNAKYHRKLGGRVLDVALNGSRGVVIVVDSNNDIPEVNLRRIDSRGILTDEPLKCGTDQVCSLRFAADDQICVLGRRTEGLTVVDVANWRILETVDTNQSLVCDVALSNRESGRCASCNGNEVIVLDRENWRIVGRWNPRRNDTEKVFIEHCDISSDGKWLYLAVSSYDEAGLRMIYRVGVSSLNENPRENSVGAVYHEPHSHFAGVRVSPDGNWVASVAFGLRGPEIIFSSMKAFEIGDK